MSANTEKGFASPIVVLVVLAAVGLISTSFVPVHKNYSDGKSNVNGISIGESGYEPKIATDEGKTAIIKGNFGAISEFPIKLTTDKKAFDVETPEGLKSITIMPDQALKAMLSSKILDDIHSEVTTGDLASNPNLVKLEQKAGVLGYSVEGDRIHDLLGTTAIKSHVEAFVSAENGQVVESTQSLLGRLLNKIAP